MKPLLFALALLLVPTEVFACGVGDTLVGPNCVHTEWVQYGQLKQQYTTLYRGDDSTKNVTWADFGDLKDSEAGFITIYGIHGELDKFVWDPQTLKYVWPR